MDEPNQRTVLQCRLEIAERKDSKRKVSGYIPYTPCFFVLWKYCMYTVRKRL